MSTISIRLQSLKTNMCMYIKIRTIITRLLSKLYYIISVVKICVKMNQRIN